MRVVIMLAVALFTIGSAAWGEPVRQKEFASADEAVQGLITALRTGDKQSILEVLGEKSAPAIDSGDPVQDKNAREQFLQAYGKVYALDDNKKGKLILEVGNDKWPFPFPIVKHAANWIFDSAAGVDEIVNRRVGANELATIQSCLAFVDAQREYYTRNPDGDTFQHYAQKLISSDGKRDGLYWRTLGAESPSPLGEEFVRARGEGYFKTENPKAEPFHGYMYRLLTKQGTHAKGGAYDYFVAGNMMGGFALLAFPAEYGKSGVMTFIVNHDGIVYSKDLGTNTPKTALSIDSFDPDKSWKQEAVIE
jgi:hypothetical protein